MYDPKMTTAFDDNHDNDTSKSDEPFLVMDLEVVQCQVSPTIPSQIGHPAPETLFNINVDGLRVRTC